MYQQNHFIVRQPLYCTPHRTKRACEMAISADNNRRPLSKAVVDVIQFEFGAQIMALLAQTTNLNNQQNQSYGFYLSIAERCSSTSSRNLFSYSSRSWFGHIFFLSCIYIFSYVQKSNPSFRNTIRDKLCIMKAFIKSHFKVSLVE